MNNGHVIISRKTVLLNNTDHHISKGLEYAFMDIRQEISELFMKPGCYQVRWRIGVSELDYEKYHDLLEKYHQENGFIINKGNTTCSGKITITCNVDAI